MEPEPTARPPAALELRRIAADEAEALREIRLRALATDPVSFSSTHAGEAAYGAGHWARRAAESSSGSERAVFLALGAGRPLGIAAAYRDDVHPSLFRIVSVWVAPEARGGGVAAGLLAAAERWIAESGGAEAQLDVTSSAAPARRLYARCGYLPDGATHPNMHVAGVTEISLRKALGGRPSA